MKCNVGGWDRTLRVASGASTVAFALFGHLNRRKRALVLSLGALQLISGLSRYCPLNQALGINTCEAVDRMARAARQLV